MSCCNFRSGWVLRRQLGGNARDELCSAEAIRAWNAEVAAFSSEMQCAMCSRMPSKGFLATIRVHNVPASVRKTFMSARDSVKSLPRSMSNIPLRGQPSCQLYFQRKHIVELSSRPEHLFSPSLSKASAAARVRFSAAV